MSRHLGPAASLTLMLAAVSPLTPLAAGAQSLFGAADVDQSRFVLVAAPIGTSGDRFQLNIYEQINDRRPCFSVASGLPAAVDPLLGSFDFTGICNRYIDANGYSLRIAGTDLATSYRLTVRSERNGTLLVATPTREGAGPELLVARSGGPLTGFHKLQPEPGWKLMRRVFGARRLGHVYVYNEAWPASAAGGGSLPAAGARPNPRPSSPTPGAPPLPPSAGAAARPTTPGAAAGRPGAAPPAQAPSPAGAAGTSGAPSAVGRPAQPGAGGRPPAPAAAPAGRPAALPPSPVMPLPVMPPPRIPPAAATSPGTPGRAPVAAPAKP